MNNQLAIVCVGPYTGSTENPATSDKNGKNPVYLTAVAGKVPNRNILSGTIAERAGMKTGNSYLVSITEGEVDPQYGRRFNFTVLASAGIDEILSGVKSLGNGEIYDVAAKTPVTASAIKGSEAVV